MVPGANPSPLYIPWPQPFLSVIWLCFLGYWLCAEWELMTPGCKGIYFESVVPIISPPWVFLFEWGLNVRDWKKDIKFTELKGVNLDKNKKSHNYWKKSPITSHSSGPGPSAGEESQNPQKSAQCNVIHHSKRFIAIIFTKNRALNTFPLGHFWGFRRHAPESKNMTPIQKNQIHSCLQNFSKFSLRWGGIVYTLPIL